MDNYKVNRQQPPEWLEQLFELVNDVVESIKPGKVMTAENIKRIDEVQKKIVEMYDVIKQDPTLVKQPEKLNGIRKVYQTLLNQIKLHNVVENSNATKWAMNVQQVMEKDVYTDAEPTVSKQNPGVALWNKVVNPDKGAQYAEHINQRHFWSSWF